MGFFFPTNWVIIHAVQHESVIYLSSMEISIFVVVVVYICEVVCAIRKRWCYMKHVKSHISCNLSWWKTSIQLYIKYLTKRFVWWNKILREHDKKKKVFLSLFKYYIKGKRRRYLQISTSKYYTQKNIKYARNLFK